jgi:GNAT superfamily N-acetyltransferase
VKTLIEAIAPYSRSSSSALRPPAGSSCRAAPVMVPSRYGTHSPRTRRINLGRIRRAGRAQQRRLRWLLVHRLPPGVRAADQPREVKEDRVRTGRAHAALVIDGNGLAQGWCQYGSPEELPGIKHKREYDKDPPPVPDRRITCIFVDKRHRAQGIARTGLEGALDQIARLGGGLVEAIPDVAAGREAQGRLSLQRDGRALRAIRLRTRSPRRQARLDCEQNSRTRVSV